MTLAEYFSDYQAYHVTRGNRVCHGIGIPILVVAILGLLAHAGGPPFLNGGLIFWALATAWMLWLDWRLAVPYSFLTLAAYFLGLALAWPTLLGLFVIGWVFQGVGHAVYEKKSPAFLHGAQHLLIGPFWIYASVARSRT